MSKRHRKFVNFTTILPPKWHNTSVKKFACESAEPEAEREPYSLGLNAHPAGALVSNRSLEHS
jgi:hypothetical protein